jgi:hypothetical protein
MMQWRHETVQIANRLHLSAEEDIILWKLEPARICIVSYTLMTHPVYPAMNMKLAVIFC